MFGNLSISVIIPTYNGAQKVVQALDSLLSQSRMPDEIIVVIDGSTDNTKSIIESKNYKFPHFRILEQENGGRAKVRNTGASDATSELLLFMDDDMVAPKQWVEEHLKHHILHPNTLLTGRLEESQDAVRDDFFLFKNWLKTKWNKGLEIEGNQSSYRINFPYISANNFSANKVVFFRLDGFDSRLTDAEDYDLALRATKQNLELFYGFAAFAYHNDITDIYKYIKRLRQYNAAQLKLMALKPELYTENHRYFSPKPKGIKAIIFRLFCNRLVLKFVYQGYFRILPQFIRFKLYDIIVTANGFYYPEKISLY